MEADQALIAYATQSMPLPEELDVSELSDTGVAALLSRYDPTVTDRWYRALIARGNPTPFEVFATHAVDRDEVGISIDRRISEHDFSVLDDLVRLGVVWSHPDIEHALGTEHHASAFWLLTEVDLEAADAWLHEAEDLDLILESLTVWGMLGIEEGLDHVDTTRSALDSDSSRDADRARQTLDCATAMMSPEAYARRLLRGDAEDDWMRSRKHVASWMQITGPSSWLLTLGLIDAADHSQAFEFAAYFGVAAACAAFFDDSPALQEICFEVLTNPDFDESLLSQRSEFSLILSLTEDTQFEQMLVEAAAHEYLSRVSGAVAIAGLPLSGGQLDESLVDEAKQTFTQIARSDFHEDQVVAAVRMFSDLAYWARKEPVLAEPLVDIAQNWATARFPKVVQGAARHAATAAGRYVEANEAWTPALQILSEGGRDAILTSEHARIAAGDDVAAIVALEQLARTRAGITDLLELWRTGPPMRADLYRDAVYQALITWT